MGGWKLSEKALRKGRLRYEAGVTDGINKIKQSHESGAGWMGRIYTLGGCRIAILQLGNAKRRSLITLQASCQDVQAGTVAAGKTVDARAVVHNGGMAGLCRWDSRARIMNFHDNQIHRRPIIIRPLAPPRAPPLLAPTYRHRLVPHSFAFGQEHSTIVNFELSTSLVYFPSACDLDPPYGRPFDKTLQLGRSPLDVRQAVPRS